MKTLPNGITVFNATPHTIRFWSEGWEEPIEVESDEVINATPKEIAFDWKNKQHGIFVEKNPTMFVETVFLSTQEGENTLRKAFTGGADIVVGSIIAAQAYPGYVVAMTPAIGYERVSPDQKRMNPDKFTVF